MFALPFGARLLNAGNALPLCGVFVIRPFGAFSLATRSACLYSILNFLCNCVKSFGNHRGGIVMILWFVVVWGFVMMCRRIVRFRKKKSTQDHSGHCK